MATAVPRVDPNEISFIVMILDDAARDKFCREHGLLAPEPAPLLPRTSGAGGHNASSQVWGYCRDLGFNPAKPDCTGCVVSRMRKQPKGPRPPFDAASAERSCPRKTEQV